MSALQLLEALGADPKAKQKGTTLSSATQQQITEISETTHDYWCAILPSEPDDEEEPDEDDDKKDSEISLH